MPLIDMPLEELKTYQGRNPRPDDFDEYWDTALAEMRGVDPQLELKPSGYELPRAECFAFISRAWAGPNPRQVCPAQEPRQARAAR